MANGYPPGLDPSMDPAMGMDPYAQPGMQPGMMHQGMMQQPDDPGFFSTGMQAMGGDPYARGAFSDISRGYGAHAIGRGTEFGVQAWQMGAFMAAPLMVGAGQHFAAGAAAGTHGAGMGRFGAGMARFGGAWKATDPFRPLMRHFGAGFKFGAGGAARSTWAAGVGVDAATGAARTGMAGFGGGLGRSTLGIGMDFAAGGAHAGRFGRAGHMAMQGARLGRGIVGGVAAATPLTAALYAGTEAVVQTGMQAYEADEAMKMGQLTLAQSAPRTMQYSQAGARQFGLHSMQDMSRDSGLGIEELGALTQELSNTGTFTGVRDLREFQTKLRQALGQLKEIASTTNTTLAEAHQVTTLLKSQGIQGPGVAGTAQAMFAQSAVSGLGVEQIAGAGLQGGQIARQFGISRQHGFESATQGLTTMQRGYETGDINRNLVDFYGGSEQASMMTQTMVMQRMMGSRMHGYIMDPTAAANNQQVIDPERMQRVISGQVTEADLKSVSPEQVNAAMNANAREQFAPYARVSMVNHAMQGTTSLQEAAEKMGREHGFSAETGSLIIQQQLASAQSMRETVGQAEVTAGAAARERSRNRPGAWDYFKRDLQRGVGDRVQGAWSDAGDQVDSWGEGVTRGGPAMVSVDEASVDLARRWGGGTAGGRGTGHQGAYDLDQRAREDLVREWGEQGDYRSGGGRESLVITQEELLQQMRFEKRNMDITMDDLQEGEDYFAVEEGWGNRNRFISAPDIEKTQTIDRSGRRRASRRTTEQRTQARNIIREQMEIGGGSHGWDAINWSSPGEGLSSTDILFAFNREEGEGRRDPHSGLQTGTTWEPGSMGRAKLYGLGKQMGVIDEEMTIDQFVGQTSRDEQDRVFAEVRAAGWQAYDDAGYTDEIEGERLFGRRGRDFGASRELQTSARARSTRTVVDEAFDELEEISGLSGMLSIGESGAGKRLRQSLHSNASTQRDFMAIMRAAEAGDTDRAKQLAMDAGEANPELRESYNAMAKHLRQGGDLMRGLETGALDEMEKAFGAQQYAEIAGSNEASIQARSSAYFEGSTGREALSQMDTDFMQSIRALGNVSGGGRARNQQITRGVLSAVYDDRGDREAEKVHANLASGGRFQRSFQQMSTLMEGDSAQRETLLESMGYEGEDLVTTLRSIDDSSIAQEDRLQSALDIVSEQADVSLEGASEGEGTAEERQGGVSTQLSEAASALQAAAAALQQTPPGWNMQGQPAPGSTGGGAGASISFGSFSFNIGAGLALGNEATETSSEEGG